MFSSAKLCLKFYKSYSTTSTVSQGARKTNSAPPPPPPPGTFHYGSKTYFRVSRTQSQLRGASVCSFSTMRTLWPCRLLAELYITWVEGDACSPPPPYPPSTLPPTPCPPPTPKRAARLASAVKDEINDPIEKSISFRVKFVRNGALKGRPQSP